MFSPAPRMSRIERAAFRNTSAALASKYMVES
jgi:hypothetical protein